MRAFDHKLQEVLDKFARRRGATSWSPLGRFMFAVTNAWRRCSASLASRAPSATCVRFRMMKTPTSAPQLRKLKRTDSGRSEGTRRKWSSHHQQNLHRSRILAQQNRPLVNSTRVLPVTKAVSGAPRLLTRSLLAHLLQTCSARLIPLRRRR